MPLPLVGSQASATPNDLLEFCHRTNFLINDDKSTGLAIHPCSKQLRRCNNSRVRLVNIYEVVQLFLSYVVITCYAHDVSRIFFAQVCIQINQQTSHRFCLFYIRTEHDGLGHSANLFQHLCDSLCDNLPPFGEGYVSAYILAFIQSLRYIPAQQVFLVVIRFEPLKVYADIAVRHTVRSEETVLYSL